MLTTHTSLRRIGTATVLLLAALTLSFLVTGRGIAGASAVGATNPTSAQWSCAGTKFFNSAGVGTTFSQGSSHDGGTFTYIENNNFMQVRDNPEVSPTGMIVGEFDQPKIKGDAATIEFNRQIRIVSLYLHDNDPESGEAGWSFNGVSLAQTGHNNSLIIGWDQVTSQVTISAGDDSGGVDFCYVEVNGGGEGCTPGYWKNHLASWAGTGYSPTSLVSAVFSGANAGQAGATLLQALNFGGGPGVDGAERILLRAAVASLLNASHPSVDFEMSASEVISQVSTALASNNRATILALATTLDDANNADQGCPLN
jgi:hypothetical protein